MKKVLFCASTLSHIENFHIPYLRYFKTKGYEVHIMGKPNNKNIIPYVDKIISINFEKSMFSLKNILFVFKISQIIKEEKYEVISLHTILASFFTRVGVLLSFKKHPLIINTVHGYLFDEKSSTLKKAIMLSAEKIVSRITDVIIVMNSADYNIAKKYKLYKNSLYKINGMGFDKSLFPIGTCELKHSLRVKHKLNDNDFILVYAAEFSKRKNQQFLINCLDSLISSGYKNIKLILLGDGSLFNSIKDTINELHLTNNVICPGYVSNTCEYYHLSDICVSSSRIEGLPFNIMEAMSTGLPIVASKIKGHTDLVKNNGFLYEYDNVQEFCDYIIKLYKDESLLTSMSKDSIKSSENFTLEKVYPSIINILEKEINYKIHTFLN